MFNPQSSKVSLSELVNAISASGVHQGDTVLSHCALLQLGIPQLQEKQLLPEFYLDAIFTVIGESGCLVLPSFTYSFCHHQRFNPHASMSSVNVLANYCIEHGVGYRSIDPNFSYVLVSGSQYLAFRPLHSAPLNQAAEKQSSPTSETKSDLETEIEALQVSNVSFDSDEHSIIGWLLSRNAKYLMLGFPYYLTAIHCMDQLINLPCRFYKLFTGQIELSNTDKADKRHHDCTQIIDYASYYYVRMLCPNSCFNVPKFTKLFTDCVKNNSAWASQINVGQASLGTFTLAPLLELYTNALRTDPYVYLQGPTLSKLEMAKLLDEDQPIAKEQIQRCYAPLVKL